MEWNEKTGKETNKQTNIERARTQTNGERPIIPSPWNYYSIWLSHSNCLTFLFVDCHEDEDQRWKKYENICSDHKALAYDFFSLSLLIPNRSEKNRSIIRLVVFIMPPYYPHTNSRLFTFSHFSVGNNLFAFRIFHNFLSFARFYSKVWCGFSFVGLCLS